MWTVTQFCLFLWVQFGGGDGVGSHGNQAGSFRHVISSLNQ